MLGLSPRMSLLRSLTLLTFAYSCQARALPQGAVNPEFYTVVDGLETFLSVVLENDPTATDNQGGPPMVFSTSMTTMSGQEPATSVFIGPMMSPTSTAPSTTQALPRPILTSVPTTTPRSTLTSTSTTTTTATSTTTNSRTRKPCKSTGAAWSVSMNVTSSLSLNISSSASTSSSSSMPSSISLNTSNSSSTSTSSSSTSTSISSTSTSNSASTSTSTSTSSSSSSSLSTSTSTSTSTTSSTSTSATMSSSTSTTSGTSESGGVFVEHSTTSTASTSAASSTLLTLTSSKLTSSESIMPASTLTRTAPVTGPTNLACVGDANSLSAYEQANNNGAPLLFKISNACPYSIWPEATYREWPNSPAVSVFNIPELRANGASGTYLWTGHPFWMTSARIWAKEGCNAAGENCAVGAGNAPTLFEFNIYPDASTCKPEIDYDISLVDGHTIPISVTFDTADCPSRTCTASKTLNNTCPIANLNEINHQIEGCLSSCSYLQSIGVTSGEAFELACCAGAHSTPETCPATSIWMSKACPEAYSYAYDDVAANRACELPNVVTIEYCPNGAMP